LKTGKTEHRNPDKTGNLFERLDRLDRKYESGGRLVKTENWEYKYDKEGNLIRKKDKHGAKWRYEWNDAGMLSKVKRPDATEVSFRYDALGRRIEKQFGRVFTRWVWDGNTPLHEQRSYYTLDWDEVKKENYDRETKYPLITWVFEEGTFVPAAKITEKEQFSIATNYLGTPEAMYREDGEAVWTCELNSYGKIRNWQGGSKTDCPFRYQGQYEDAETGLYYNRFRYYSPEEGMYLSQDPIGLEGNNQTLYAYVSDINGWVDVFGLSKGSGTLGKNMIRAGMDHGLDPFNRSDFQAHHVIPHEVWVDNQDFFNKIGLGSAKDLANNGVFLPRSQRIANELGFDYYHFGSHITINDSMRNKVEDVSRRFEAGIISRSQARKEISKIQKAERTRLSKRNNTDQASLCGS
jgi:RHS repeat-associated protein